MSTFGNLSQGASPTDNPSNNFVWVKALSTPASDGTLQSISVYGQIKAGSPSLGVALYSDSAGAPGSLIAAEETTMGAFAAGFGVVTTNLIAAIVAGTQYWFGIRIPGNTAGPSPDAFIHVDSGVGAIRDYFKNNSAGANFPASVTGATSDNTEDYSVFATYTPAPVIIDTGLKSHQAIRPAQFKPMGDALRPGAFKGFR